MGVVGGFFGRFGGLWRGLEVFERFWGVWGFLGWPGSCNKTPQTLQKPLKPPSPPPRSDVFGQIFHISLISQISSLSNENSLLLSMLLFYTLVQKKSTNTPKDLQNPQKSPKTPPIYPHEAQIHPKIPQLPLTHEDSKEVRSMLSCPLWLTMKMRALGMPAAVYAHTSWGVG